MKKILIFAVICLLLFSSYPGTPIYAAPAAFSDLKTTHWAYSVIGEMKELKYINGYPDGSFKPDNNITRAEFGAIINKLVLDIFPAGGKFDNSAILKDMKSSHWAYNAAREMLSHMSREDATKIFGTGFSPDKKITREEVVAVIHSILKQHADFSGLDLEKGNFTDLNQARFAESINFSVAMGIIKGYPDGTFKPKANITRAEISAILLRVARG